jgi:hypothetical protein
MQDRDFQSEWNRDGYFIVPRLFDASLVDTLRVICDDIFQQWLAESSDPFSASNNTNMAYLTEDRYFREHPERLGILLDVIAHEKLMSIFRQLFGVEPLFHNTQYFFEPANETRAGNWHRDQQFGSTSIESEKAFLSEIGFHAHIALVPDANLEIIPGTHARWDTSEEFEIRKGMNGKKTNSDDMPGAVRIRLNAGDACFFSAWSIHRGNYVAGTIRRTFDIIYGASPSEYTPPPMCFLRPEALNDVKAHTRSFFERFIAAYREKWTRGEYYQ